MLRLLLAVLFVCLVPASAAQSSEVLALREARMGIGAGSVTEAEASLTVGSRALGPVRVRLGGTLTATGEASGTGGFQLGLGLASQRGPLEMGVWASGWIQTDERVPATEADRPPLANMASLGLELTHAPEAPVSVYGGIRVYLGDERIETSASAVARLGARIRV